MYRKIRIISSQSHRLWYVATIRIPGLFFQIGIGITAVRMTGRCLGRYLGRRSMSPAMPRRSIHGAAPFALPPPLHESDQRRGERTAQLEAVRQQMEPRGGRGGRGGGEAARGCPPTPR